MSARVILTYDDYAALPDDGRRYELYEGELIMMPSPRPARDRHRASHRRRADAGRRGSLAIDGRAGPRSETGALNDARGLAAADPPDARSDRRLAVRSSAGLEGKAAHLERRALLTPSSCRAMPGPPAQTR